MKQTCSDDRLRSLLQCDEDSDESRLSARHVDQCPRCQLRLEELAAEPAEWRMVKHSLLHGEDEDIESNEASTLHGAVGSKPSVNGFEHAGSAIPWRGPTRWLGNSSLHPRIQRCWDGLGVMKSND